MNQYVDGWWEGLKDELPKVDNPNVMNEALTNESLRDALEYSRPRNWHGSGAGEELLRVAKEEGLPLAWIPRVAIISRMAQSKNGAERNNLLLSNDLEILEDCEIALAECQFEKLQESKVLVAKAIQAFKEGHIEAAMALAVSVGEPLAIWASNPRVQSFDSKEAKTKWSKTKDYKKAEKEFPPSEAKIDPGDFIRLALIAPIPTFYTSYYPNNNDPIPKKLSRHLVAHNPIPEHFNKINALKSIMLCCSILRDQEQWCIENNYFPEELNT